MKDAYLLVVHVVNILLLGVIGFILFGLTFNISEPGPVPNFSIPVVGTILVLLVLWAVGYWLQIKKRKWILPIVAVPTFIFTAYILLGTVVPYLDRMIYL